MAAFAIPAGAVLLLFPRLVEVVTIAGNERQAARIAELEAGAAETYFEELRDLKAYPLPARPRTWRVIGAALLLLGVGMLYLALTRS